MRGVLLEEVGFEPTKKFSSDLQSDAVDHLATLPPYLSTKFKKVHCLFKIEGSWVYYLVPTGESYENT